MTKKEFRFSNGDKVVEKITGFSGTITGTCFYLTGCNQYLITAKSDKNKEPMAIWYDEGRLELVKNKAFTESDVKGDNNGCDLPPNMGKRGC